MGTPTWRAGEREKWRHAFPFSTYVAPPAECWRGPGRCGRPAASVCRALSSVALSSVRFRALGPALSAAGGSIWCVLFCDIVALCLLLLMDCTICYCICY